MIFFFKKKLVLDKFKQWCTYILILWIGDYFCILPKILFLYICSKISKATKIQETIKSLVTVCVRVCVCVCTYADICVCHLLWHHSVYLWLCTFYHNLHALAYTMRNTCSIWKGTYHKIVYIDIYMTIRNV